MNEDIKLLLRTIPDLPRFVEARSLLLSGRGQVFRQNNDARNFIVVDSNDDLVILIGRPEQMLLDQALVNSSNAVLVLGLPENQEYVTDLLSDWRMNTARIHILRNAIAKTVQPGCQVEFATENQVRSLEPYDPKLTSDLRTAISFTRVAASFCDGEPVSFCYSGHETETLWDVSIDTLPGYRKRGYAEACARFMIDFMGRKGKRPVWGAEEDNIASLKLALNSDLSGSTNYCSYLQM